MYVTSDSSSLQISALEASISFASSRSNALCSSQAVFAEAPIDADIFLSYLHHNYPPFTNEIDECVGIGEALSAADAVMSGKSEGEEVRSSYSDGLRRCACDDALRWCLPSCCRELAL